MHTPRKRTLVTNAGLLTAVTLSLCLLAGCNGARFMMGGDPTQPTPATASQAPVNTAGTPMTLKTFTVTGNANYFGEPYANAKVTIYDAITGEPAQVISAGGGNVISAGGGNYAVSSARSFVQVATPSVSTDANGNFTLTFQAPANAQGDSLPIRIVVEDTSPPADAAANRVLAVNRTQLRNAIRARLLSAIARFSGSGLDRTSSPTPSPSATPSPTQVVVNPASTIATQNSFGILSIMKGLKTDAAVDVSYGYLVELGKLTKSIEEKITKEDFQKFQDTVDKTGKMTDDTGLRAWLTEKGVAGLMDATTKAGLNSVAAKAADPKNVAQNVNVTASDFVGSNFEIKIVNDQLVVVNSTTGETTSFNLGAGTPGTGGSNPDGTPTTSTTDGITEDPNLSGDPDVAPVFSSTNFNPSVTLSKGGGSLTVDVTQPGGSDDIAVVFARVKKSDATGSFFTSPHTLTAAAGSQVTLTKTGQTLDLTLVQDNALNFTAEAGPRFGNPLLTAPLWQGWLRTDSGQNVAKFGVFATTDYYYLVTRFALSDAVTINSGHHTVLITNNAALGSTAKAEISIISRRGEIVERTN
jgi:hypothetical protein